MPAMKWNQRKISRPASLPVMVGTTSKAAITWCIDFLRELFLEIAPFATPTSGRHSEDRLWLDSTASLLSALQSCQLRKLGVSSASLLLLPKISPSGKRGQKGGTRPVRLALQIAVSFAIPVTFG